MLPTTCPSNSLGMATRRSPTARMPASLPAQLVAQPWRCGAAAGWVTWRWFVTRYFGGTKLGTGGLVRAYSEAVRLVVDAVPRAEKVLTHTIMLVFSYTYLERVRLLVASNGNSALDS